MATRVRGAMAKLVYQRRPDDCHRAAVATLLGIPYEHTPTIYGFTAPGEVVDDAEFSNRWQAWAADRALRFVMHRSHAPVHRRGWIALIDRESYVHSVVMDRDRLWHDPTHVESARLRTLDLDLVRAAVSIVGRDEDPWKRRPGDPQPRPIARPFDSPEGVAILLSRGEVETAREMAVRVGTSIEQVKKDFLNA
jgi:hypothetical protein